MDVILKIPRLKTQFIRQESLKSIDEKEGETPRIPDFKEKLNLASPKNQGRETLHRISPKHQSTQVLKPIRNSIAQARLSLHDNKS
jgi:hypothetical protein